MLKEREIIANDLPTMMTKINLSQSALQPLTLNGDSFGTLEKDLLTENQSMIK